MEVAFKSKQTGVIELSTRWDNRIAVVSVQDKIEYVGECMALGTESAGYLSNRGLTVAEDSFMIDNFLNGFLFEELEDGSLNFYNATEPSIHMLINKGDWKWKDVK